MTLCRYVMAKKMSSFMHHKLDILKYMIFLPTNWTNKLTLQYNIKMKTKT